MEIFFEKDLKEIKKEKRQKEEKKRRNNINTTMGYIKCNWKNRSM